MEIALAADVAVAQGLVVGRLVEENAIKAVLEDRTDRGNRASLDQDAASAGPHVRFRRLQTLVREGSPLASGAMDSGYDAIPYRATRTRE